MFQEYQDVLCCRGLEYTSGAKALGDKSGCVYHVCFMLLLPEGCKTRPCSFGTKELGRGLRRLIGGGLQLLRTQFEHGVSYSCEYPA
jgi:hypothetical protein